MAYVEISKSLIRAGAAFSTTLGQLIADNFSDHEVRISSLEGSSSDPIPAGVILTLARSTAPVGYLECDGSEVSRVTYAALFSAIGTNHGSGDGSTTFNLPDLRGRASIGAGTGVGLTARTLGSQVGTETHTLTTSEMGSHNHGITDPGHSHLLNTNATGSGANAFLGASNLDNGGFNTASSATGISTQSTGSGGAHNNIQKSLVIKKFIKV